MVVGSNFMPTYAINQLEMFQPDTFNITRIDEELSWAENLGMNTMRVFLHDLLYQQDATGFKQRLDTFLGVCDKHGIRPLLVIFDSCWDPLPKLGKQHAPWPGVHNSGWVQSPGAAALTDSSQYPRLETYVKDLVGTFANDARILGWDVWNEPDNGGGGDYNTNPSNKTAYVNLLLPQVFQWARSVNPIQPLTSPLWTGFYNSPLYETEFIQLNYSDVISFHGLNGGTVASISNTFENNDITSYISKSNSNCAGVLIGYVAKAEFGQGSSTDWYWYNGDKSGFTNWASGNPINDQSSFCAVLNQANGQWTSQSCDISVCQLCQINLI
uniref:C-type lectin domain-containing protein n=1 Tax=Acrobeloides nanus TaxID=290746 RepID=A0A914C351_9BILA